VSSGPLVIVGDALLDRDIAGHAARLCPDAPFPVVEAPTARERPGGAGLAALLATSVLLLSADDVTLIAPLGTDRASQAMRGLLPDDVFVIALPLRGALQERTWIMADGRPLLRLDTPAPVPGQAGTEAVAAIEGADAALVSDYGHGTTASQVIRDALAALAIRAPVVWHPRSRESRPVPGTWLAILNAAEADHAGPNAAAAAERLLDRWPTRAIAVTLGPRGALLARRCQPPLAIPTSPAGAGHARGAGDMFAVAAAAALRAGARPGEAVTWAVDTASRFVGNGGLDSLEAGEAPAATSVGEWIRPAAHGRAASHPA